MTEGCRGQLIGTIGLIPGQNPVQAVVLELFKMRWGGGEEVEKSDLRTNNGLTKEKPEAVDRNC